MLGDHPQRHVAGGVVAVGRAGEVDGPVDHGAQHVGVEDVAGVLQQDRHALEAHAGVDVLLGQVAEDGPVLVELVLHEHDVVVLEVALVVDGRAAGLAPGLAPVVVQLGVGTAGTGVVGPPVVVLGPEALDALGRQVGLVEPELLGLVVVLVDGGPDPVGVEPEGVDGQLPGPADGLALEVVAEREVAEHLEHRHVAGGAADVLDVVGAHALLVAGDPRGGRRGVAHEVGLERDHAGDRQQQGGVLRDQRRGVDDAVVALAEELEEGLADARGVHGGLVGAGGRRAGVACVEVRSWGRAGRGRGACAPVTRPAEPRASSGRPTGRAARPRGRRRRGWSRPRPRAGGP